MATPRLRHRPQTEDEDAAALKLGPGMPSLHVEKPEHANPNGVQNSTMPVVYSYPR